MQTTLGALYDYSASPVAAMLLLLLLVLPPLIFRSGRRPLWGAITQRLHCNLLLGEFELPSLLLAAVPVILILWPPSSVKLPFNRTSGSE